MSTEVPYDKRGKVAREEKLFLRETEAKSEEKNGAKSWENVKAELNRAKGDMCFLLWQIWFKAYFAVDEADKLKLKNPSYEKFSFY